MSDPKKKKRRKKHPFVVLLIIILALAGAVAIMHIDYFDVQGIAVVGNEEISDEEITHLSKVEIGKSIIDAHPIIIKHRIKQNLYIEDVDVSREFPNKIKIIIKEKKCLVQFQNGNKYVVADKDGMVVEIASQAREVTMIDGISVSEAKTKKDIKVDDEKLLAKYFEFINITQKNDLYFKRVSIDGNKVDAYVFDSLICSGKYADMTECIESGTLKSVIYDLYQKGTESGAIKVYANDYCFFTQ